MTSKRKLKKEVQEHIELHKKLVKSKKKCKEFSLKTLKEELGVEEDYNVKVQAEKEQLRSCSNDALAEWIIEKHDDFVETINWGLSQDFLNGTTYEDRYYIIVYMHELNRLLAAYEIEIPQGVIDILEKKNYGELLLILHTLNYI